MQRERENESERSNATNIKAFNVINDNKINVIIISAVAETHDIYYVYPSVIYIVQYSSRINTAWRTAV